MAKAFTSDVIKPVLQLHLHIMRNFYANIQNIPVTLGGKNH